MIKVSSSTSFVNAIISLKVKFSLLTICLNRLTANVNIACIRYVFMKTEPNAKDNPNDINILSSCKLITPSDLLGQVKKTPVSRPHPLLFFTAALILFVLFFNL